MFVIFLIKIFYTSVISIRTGRIR